MLRTTLAIAFAGLIFVAVSGTTQASPANALTDVNILTDGGVASLLARSLGPPPLRRCWRDRWGRVRCW